ncbi:MAG: hypothetical protein FWC68_02130 [Oscillospiraceae bacterium]|nr:hypothetical protein [Oscillospiraceae bacterium]
MTTLLNPLRRSEERIREDVLLFTPVGSSMEKVIEAIENNRRWTNEHVIYDRGYAIMRAGSEGEHTYFSTIYYAEGSRPFVRTVGVETIRLNIGSYTDPSATTVVLVHWAFGENGELIDIAVRKEVTSL